MIVDVLASFIEPVIEFSQKSLHFQQNVQPGEEARALEQEMRIGNISSLPLTAVITVDKPFSMVLPDNTDQQITVSATATFEKVNDDNNQSVDGQKFLD